MNPRTRIGLSMFIVLGVLIGIGMINHHIVYSGEPYQMSIVKSNLVLALDTHNIEAKVGYIDSTVEMLEAYHGNSAWWYPTHTSDIDQTRNLLITVSSDVKEQLDVKERDHYFILPHNELVSYMNSEITKSTLRLDDYASGAYWHPENNIISYIVYIAFIPMIITGVIFLCAGDSYSYRRDWEERENKKKRDKENEKRKIEADRKQQEILANRKQGATLPKGY